MQLPPALGTLDREPVIVLVTGRTAVVRIGGMASVARHVAAIRRLQLEPIVLFPDRMRALGAEISCEVGDDVLCVPADRFGDEAGSDDALVLVIAGDWFISPRAIMEFIAETDGPALARFNDRGRTVAPLARIRVAALKEIIPRLADAPSGELINNSALEPVALFPLDVTERHRLSDNVAVARAENKLFNRVAVTNESRLFEFVQSYLSLPITRRLAATPVTPLQVSMAKVGLGLLAATAIAGGGYAPGLFGALLFFLSRVLDGVAGELARAAVRDGSAGEKVDFAGDLAVHFAMLFALAQRGDAGDHADILALVAFAGVAVSAAVAYQRVFRHLWASRAQGRLQQTAPASFAARFANRNGVAWALLLTGLFARLDLFLWAAAISSHLYYLLWLGSDRKSSMAIGNSKRG
ncbi:MAG: hypothetical protein ACE5E4_07580 [Candidatus Binatia bacterium]